MTDITLETLSVFSGRSGTLVTVDVPLFGNVLIFNGRVLNRGTYVEADKVGSTIGFPAPSQVVAEAKRFWIQDNRGVRQRKTREEMAQLLEESIVLSMKV